MSMMSHRAALRLGVSCEALAPQLALLLATQRAEEPETPISVEETSCSDLLDGLQGGRFDIGLTSAVSQRAHLAVSALWTDELALAVPHRSPLLVYPAVSLAALRPYSLFYANDSVTATQTRPSAPEAREGESTTVSFEVMLVLVAAGYGVGVGRRSRMAHARSWGIAMRALADAPHEIRVDMLRPPNVEVPAVDRFCDRARKIKAAGLL